MRCLLTLIGVVVAFPAFGQQEPSGHRFEHAVKKPVAPSAAHRLPVMATPWDTLRHRSPLETHTTRHGLLGSTSGVLDLQGCPVDDQMCQDIARIHAPVELRLVCTWITDDGLIPLSRLTTLKELDLRGTRISDDGVASLVRMSSLQVVDVRGTRITQAGVARLRASRPELLVLSATICDGR